jgi:hypothetical protein
VLENAKAKVQGAALDALATCVRVIEPGLAHGADALAPEGLRELDARCAALARSLEAADAAWAETGGRVAGPAAAGRRDGATAAHARCTPADSTEDEGEGGGRRAALAAAAAAAEDCDPGGYSSGNGGAEHGRGRGRSRGSGSGSGSRGDGSGRGSGRGAASGSSVSGATGASGFEGAWPYGMELAPSEYITR